MLFYFSRALNYHTHRNEVSGMKTLNLKNQPTFVKEKHMLDRQRITVLTQISSNPNFMQLKPHFVFKGKGM